MDCHYPRGTVGSMPVCLVVPVFRSISLCSYIWFLKFGPVSPNLSLPSHRRLELLQYTKKHALLFIIQNFFRSIEFIIITKIVFTILPCSREAFITHPYNFSATSSSADWTTIITSTRGFLDFFVVNCLDVLLANGAISQPSRS